MPGKRFCAGAALVIALLLPSTALGARHVYVSNSTSPGAANVSAFTLASNGALQPNGAPAGSGALGAEGVVASPDGSHLYVANGDTPGTVGVLSIATDGTLASQGAPTPAGGNQPTFLALAPDGGHLYVQLNGSNNLSVLTVSANGTLMPQASGIAAGTAPTGLAISPDGKSLYAADFNLGGAGSVVRFSVASNGTLTPQGATPTGGAGAFQMTITPDGRFLYVTNTNSKDVSGFAVAGSGALTPVPGGPVATGSADPAYAIAATPDGTRVYVSNGERSLSGFDVNPATGALSLVPGSPFTVGSGSQHSALAVAPDGGQVLQTLETPASLSSYAIAANGSLTQASSVASGGSAPDFQAVAPRPNQPPTAVFTTKSLQGGKVHFKATSSKDSDGKVATYRWDFGDGTPPTDVTKAGTDHVYTLAGKYTARLETIDNEGCSTQLVFTGQSALCNGSGVASVSHSFRSSVQFTLTARPLQRARVIRATGLCPTEACNVQLGGSVKVGSRTLTLRRTRRGLAPAVARTWRMRLPRRALRALKALPRHKTLKVRVTAAARAASGQGRNTSRQRNVKMRGLRRRR